MCDLYDSRYVPSNQSYDRIIRLLDFVDTKTVARINLEDVSEPLLDKQGIIRFMQKAIRKGFGFCFTTNGTFLTEDYLDLLIENGLSEINISLDSAVPKIHDAIRAVKGLGSSILSVLRYAKRKYPSFKITILSTIMTINTDSIQGLVALVNELDL